MDYRFENCWRGYRNTPIRSDWQKCDGYQDDSSADTSIRPLSQKVIRRYLQVCCQVEASLGQICYFRFHILPKPLKSLKPRFGIHELLAPFRSRMPGHQAHLVRWFAPKVRLWLFHLFHLFLLCLPKRSKLSKWSPWIWSCTVRVAYCSYLGWLVGHGVVD